MNKVYLQRWEESERGLGTRPDGCSLHLTLKDRDKYLTKIYEGTTFTNVPDEYDRIVGNPIEISISDVVFSEVNVNGALRISEYEMKNLLKMGEIV